MFKRLDIQEIMQRRDTVEEDMSFTKYNQDKFRPSLVPPEAIEAMATAMEYGCKKYSRDNWRKCDDHTVYVDAAMRHYLEYQKGNEIDEDSGLPHLDLILCNFGFAVALKKEGK